MKKYLDISSKRITVYENNIGLDGRILFYIQEHKRWFKDSWYSIEMVFSRRENVFTNKEVAILFAKKCIADLHDLIERE